MKIFKTAQTNIIWSAFFAYTICYNRHIQIDQKTYLVWRILGKTNIHESSNARRKKNLKITIKKESWIESQSAFIRGSAVFEDLLETSVLLSQCWWYYQRRRTFRTELHLKRSKNLFLHHIIAVCDRCNPYVSLQEKRFFEK